MSGCECRVCGYYHPGEGCVIDDALVSKLARERDEARAEVERLRKSVEDWHDAAVRAERNAAMSQEETIKLIEKNAHLNEVNEAIKRTTKAWREDAERYRWLRDEALNSDLPYFGKIDRRAWDSEIDAAMQEDE